MDFDRAARAPRTEVFALARARSRVSLLAMSTLARRRFSSALATGPLTHVLVSVSRVLVNRFADRRIDSRSAVKWRVPSSVRSKYDEARTKRVHYSRMRLNSNVLPDYLTDWERAPLAVLPRE